MCVKAWHHLGIRLTSGGHHRCHLVLLPPALQCPPDDSDHSLSFLPTIKSQHLEREFSPLLAEVASCEGGEERWGCWHYVTSQWHLSDTCAHILTNEWQSDQNIWAIKTENNIHRPLDWSHWLPSLTQLGWTRNTSPSLRSNIAECLLDANIIY